MLQEVHPLKLAGLLLGHGWSLVRTASLMTVEYIVAVVDCARGVTAGNNLWKELMMVPARVTIGVLLRELSTIGACMDVTRGLPVVHINFLGYDEQAHRRGPGSAFARWGLKGIDRAVCCVWRSAHRSDQRHYDVWIYSDHGQEPTHPYHRQHGCTVQEAITRLLDHPPEHPRREIDTDRASASSRAIWLGGGRFIQWLLGGGKDNTDPGETPVVVVGMGPVGLVYPNQEISRAEQQRLALAMVHQAHIPAVLTASQPGMAVATTAQGTCCLPAEAERVLGANHPFLTEAARDLVRLCHHPDAGRFVLLGWQPRRQAISFQVENGAHAGPGSEETRGFCLLPIDAPVHTEQRA